MQGFHAYKLFMK